jgi:transposase
MKAYSIDLRQKIIDAYHSQPISQRQLALQFGIALSFLQKLLKQYRQTGDVAPKPHAGGGQLQLTAEQLETLAELIEQKNDATLEELGQMLEEKTGVKVSRATMGRMTQRLNMTVKKKHFSPQRKQAKESKDLELSSGNKSETCV